MKRFIIVGVNYRKTSTLISFWVLVKPEDGQNDL